jgi:opacity protein-like surface antigen
LVLALSPTTAYADWLFTPAIGATFGSDTHGARDLIYSAAIGWLDEDAFGWEADLSYAPEFFEGDTDHFEFNGSGSVVTAMVNALIGVPVRGQHGGAFRPYVTGGVGLMQMHVLSEGGLFESTTREFGFNLGVGAMAFMGDRFGLRGDFRYLRSFQDQVPSWTRGLDVDIAPGSFDYWRGTFGVTFRFPQ